MFKVGDRVLYRDDKPPYKKRVVRYVYTDGSVLVFSGERKEDVMWPYEISLVSPDEIDVLKGML